MAYLSVFLGIFQRPTIAEVVGELVILMVPLWIAIVVGVLVGWAWKPRWADKVNNLLDCSAIKYSSTDSDATSRGFGLIPSLNGLKLQLPGFISRSSSDGIGVESGSATASSSSSIDFKLVQFLTYQFPYLHFSINLTVKLFVWPCINK